VNRSTAFAVAFSRHFLLLLLMLAALLAHKGAFANSPELYGQEYVRLDQSWVDDGPGDLPALREENIDADENAYLEQLQKQELSGGPYSGALAEPLSSLGHYYRNQGRFNVALDFYERALHVLRVNDGLHSERQIPLIRNLLDTHRLAGDMQALDERYDYFFSLHGKGEPPHTDLRLRAALEYLRWKRESYLLKVGGSKTSRLLAMYQLNKRILDSTAQSAVVGQDWYRQLVLSQVRNLYLIESEIELTEETYSFQTRRPLPSGRDQDLNFGQRQLVDIQRTSSAKARSLLQELIVRTAENGESIELASIHLELGDWHLWNGLHLRAKQEYSIVFQILEDAGDTQLFQQWFVSPTELPANPALWQVHRLARDSRGVVLSAEYDVTARGKARNIQVYADKPEEETYATRLRRKLAATQFRPRFASGEAEAVKRVSRKYELIVD
jgi:tetratricopeptide (TPR) repeat protein